MQGVNRLEWVPEGSPRPRLLTRSGELSTPCSLAKLPHRGCENATVPPRQGFTHQTAIIRGDFQGVTSSTKEAGTGGAQPSQGMPSVPWNLHMLLETCRKSTLKRLKLCAKLLLLTNNHDGSIGGHPNAW